MLNLYSAKFASVNWAIETLTGGIPPDYLISLYTAINITFLSEVRLVSRHKKTG